jgi:hypothetical protein
MTKWKKVDPLAALRLSFFPKLRLARTILKKKEYSKKQQSGKKKKNETTYTYPISPLAHIPKPSLNLKRLKAKSINNPLGPATSPPS